MAHVDAADAAAAGGWPTAGWRRAWRAHAARRSCAEISEPQHAPVIIAGFGRYGQIVGRLLYANGLTATVLDHDAEQVEAVRRFGWQVFYGDATRLDLLRTAGADKARVLVLAIDDVEQSLAVAELVREHFPQLTIVARARNVTHYYQLRELGVHADRARDARLGADERRAACSSCWAGSRTSARTLALRFRRHNVELLEADGAALRRRGQADRRGQAGPPAARGAVRAGARGKRARQRAGWVRRPGRAPQRLPRSWHADRKCNCICNKMRHHGIPPDPPEAGRAAGARSQRPLAGAGRDPRCWRAARCRR